MELSVGLLLAALATSSWDGGRSSFSLDADEKSVRLEATSAEREIEFRLSPDGGTFNSYTFAVNANGEKTARFFSEYGHIEPDPYGPDWTAKVSTGTDGKWSVKADIPITAFYLTRAAAWKTEWKVNATSRGAGGEKSWAKAPVGVKGFPKLDGRDDLFVRSAVASVSGVRNGKPTGELKLSVLSGAPGAFTVETSCSEPQRRTIAYGEQTVSVPAAFAGAGRQSTRIRLVRADGRTYVRNFPVYVDYRPIRVKLTKPGYRDNFYPGQDAGVVEGRAVAVAGGPVTLTLDGPGFPTRTVRTSADGTFRFDTTGFQFGEATLEAKSGREKVRKKIRRLRPLPAGRHMSWIENGNLVVDGKPVVRRNIYAEGFMGGKKFDAKYRADDFHLTRNVGCIGNLDLAGFAKDLKYTEAKRDQKPSQRVYDELDKFLAKAETSEGCYYYICDEPECHGTSVVYLKHIYDYMAEKDPYHVLASCCRAGETYVEIADWFETHPYLNPHVAPDGSRSYGRAFNELGRYVDAFRPRERPDKCVGGTPTCFAYTGNDYPTFDEYVLNYWCEFVRGAKTMFPYAYHDLGDRPALYEGTRYMFESIAALEDVLLHGKLETLAKTDAYECGCWTMPEGDRMFALVNFTQKPQRVTVKGLKGRFREFRGERKFDVPSSTSTLTLDLAPLETIVACEKARDRGLKPLAEVRREIEAAEFARTHRDNQLLGRQDDMDIKTSVGRRGAWRDDAVKVFDGMYDMVAWSDPRLTWGDERYFEMSFLKFVPRFREVVVYGRDIDGYTVKIRDGGAWKLLRPVATEKTGDRIVQRFGAEHSTVKMRIDFPKRGLEVYEIELPGKAREIGRSQAATKPKGVKWTLPTPPHCATNAVWTVRQPAERTFLVVKVPETKLVKDNGYTTWMLILQGTGALCHTVLSAMPGLYTLRVPAAEREGERRLQLYNYNLDFNLGDIVCCAEPADCAELTERDGFYHVRVKLSAPCEDVTCAFFEERGRGPVMYKLRGGLNALDLKPADASRTIWVGKAEVPSQPDPNKRPFPFIRVNALGGALRDPIYTWLEKVR